jgi:hypothetical protein
LPMAEKVCERMFEFWPWQPRPVDAGRRPWCSGQAPQGWRGRTRLERSNSEFDTRMRCGSVAARNARADHASDWVHRGRSIWRRVIWSRPSLSPPRLAAIFPPHGQKIEKAERMKAVAEAQAPSEVAAKVRGCCVKLPVKDAGHGGARWTPASPGRDDE